MKGEQTLNNVYLSFLGRVLRRAFPILLSPPPSCHSPTVCQTQWHVVGRVFSSRALGIPLLLGYHCMTPLPSWNNVTWLGIYSCSHWCVALCCTVASLQVIVSRWGVSYMCLRSRAFSGSSGTQWGIGLSWSPGKWRPIPPSPVVASLSYLQ